jgi:FkbH-like protein
MTIRPSASGFVRPAVRDGARTARIRPCSRSPITSGFFECLRLTGDDTQRAAIYQARTEAKILRATIGDYGAYLESLQMELSIAPFDALGRARITQLIQKSNQFNLTTRRYSEADIEAIESDPRRLGWQVRLKDRFADHGMICVVIADKAAASWSVDTWIMSCRVLERRVEQAVMQVLAERAATSGAKELVGTYRSTPRNALVRTLHPPRLCADGPDG